MKTGLGLFRKLRVIISYINLFRFNMRKYIIGFDVANQFIQRVDKITLKLILRDNGAKIGRDCDIETGLIFHNCRNYSNLNIGNNCHIGKYCFFDLRDKIDIKNNVIISMKCTFITHMDMSKSNLSKIYPSTSGKITIEDSCYIGANSTLLMNLKCGSHSFIAAGSIVTKDVEPYTKVGGVPAKFLKKIIE